MLDTIILLMAEVERTALGSALRQHAPSLNFVPVETLAELNAIAPERLAGARLIGFTTPVIVPRRILDALGYGAYNFHPGPPNYPGWAPSHFALYDNAREFGATAHVMAEKVDSGPIVGTEFFPMTVDRNVVTLERAALVFLAKLFWRLAPALVKEEPLPEIGLSWSGKKGTRKRCAELCDIPPGISGAELQRRIKVFGGGYLGVTPTLTVHGYAFRYVDPHPVQMETPTVVQPAPLPITALAS